MKIWIYQNNKFRQADEERMVYFTDSRKELSAKFITRRWEDKWFKGQMRENYEVVYYGKTKEDCLRNVNYYINLGIANKEQEIAELKLRLVKLD